MGRGTRIEHSLVLGNGAWTNDSAREAAREAGKIVYGVGEWRSAGCGVGARACPSVRPILKWGPSEDVAPPVLRRCMQAAAGRVGRVRKRATREVRAPTPPAGPHWTC